MTEDEATTVLTDELIAETGFLARLQRHEGLDQDAVDRIVNALGALEVAWKDRDCVPKDAVLAMANIDSAIESCVHLYPGLERDLRAVERRLIRSALKSLGKRM